MNNKLAEAAKYTVEIELLTRALANLSGRIDCDEERSAIFQRLRILLELP